MQRTIVIQSQAQADMVAAIIAANWKAMASTGTPMAAHLVEHKKHATDEQRSLMWVRLGEIAEQAWVGGRQYSPEVWHEHCKREYLPEEEGPSKRCRKGYKKWLDMPDGSRQLVGSTEMLTVFGKSEYQTQIEAFGASLGVMFSINPKREAA